MSDSPNIRGIGHPYGEGHASRYYMVLGLHSHAAFYHTVSGVLADLVAADDAIPLDELHGFTAWLTSAPIGSLCDGFYPIDWVVILDGALPNEHRCEPEFYVEDADRESDFA